MDARPDEIVREDEGRIDRVVFDIHCPDVDPAAPAPAPPDARRDHRRDVTQPTTVASSTPYSAALRRRRNGRSAPGTPAPDAAPSPLPTPSESRIDQPARDGLCRHGEAAPTANPADAGRESGQRTVASHNADVALAKHPPRDAAGKGRRTADARRAAILPGKTRGARASRGAVDPTEPVGGGPLPFRPSRRAGSTRHAVEPDPRVSIPPHPSAETPKIPPAISVLMLKA